MRYKDVGKRKACVPHVLHVFANIVEIGTTNLHYAELILPVWDDFPEAEAIKQAPDGHKEPDEDEEIIEGSVVRERADATST